MPGVLSKLAIAVAAALVPSLAVLCSAQSSDYAHVVRRQGYMRAVDEEVIEPGMVEAPADGPYYQDDEGPIFEEGDDNSCLFVGGSTEENESLFPDGTFLNRGPAWYSNVAFTMMQRSAPTHQGNALPVANLFEEVLLSTGQVVVLRPLVMGTSGLDFHFTPGMRATLGRNLFEDILHRQHSLEFTFIGLNTWSTSGFAIGSGLIESSTFLKLPGLFSNFPLNGGGFSGANVMTMADSSSFSNWELNYRVAKLPRADRITQLPDGTWMQVATPTLVPSFLGGFRMFNLNDHFNWTSAGTYTSDNKNFSGAYNVKTTNLLAGAQVGGDLIMNHNIWQMGMRAKAGIYGNLAKQYSEVEIIDPHVGNQSGVGQASAPTTAFIGDLGFFGKLRLTDRITFRGGYDFMWVGGIANAAQQLQYTTDLAPVVRKNGHVLIQGVNFGADICW